MSEDEDAETPHPRATEALFGHAEAEHALLEAYRGGRMPHAWLIGGPPGIGKATLAYRLARFVLAHPDPRAADVQNATSLAVSQDQPVFRRIANEAHPDLLPIHRVINEKTGKLYANIRVDDVRRTIGFFGSTPGEGGWRVAVIDSVDELERAGENALLKVLEEPPPRSLLLLISNAPGQVLPTIRSRCRRLLLRPLDETEAAQAAAATLGRSAEDEDIRKAAAAAGGSVGRALNLLDGSALALRDKVEALLAQLPQPDQRALHALGDAISGTEPRSLATFMDIVNDWMSRQMREGAQETVALARLARASETINGAARDVGEYNLERKPLVFSVFGALSEAARR